VKFFTSVGMMPLFMVGSYANKDQKHFQIHRWKKPWETPHLAHEHPSGKCEGGPDARPKLQGVMVDLAYGNGEIDPQTRGF